MESSQHVPSVSHTNKKEQELAKIATPTEINPPCFIALTVTSTVITFRNLSLTVQYDCTDGTTNNTTTTTTSASLVKSTVWLDLY